MNVVVLTGRLTKDPEVRYTQGSTPTAVANFTLAVDRRFKKEGYPDADFIRCVAFGKTAEFVEKYARKGMKFEIQGSIQTGSFDDKDGKKVYTTDIHVEQMGFAESKSSQQSSQQEQSSQGFINLDAIGEDELPFT